MSKGRKTELTWATFLGPFTVSSIALFTGQMSAGIWSAFMGFLLPTILGIHHGANVYQKTKTPKVAKHV